MGKEKILDVVVKNIKPSNQKFIYRYHRFPLEMLEPILEDGLKPVPGNEYRHGGPLWISADDFHSSMGGIRKHGYIKLKIPKEDYKKLDFVDNPEYFDNSGTIKGKENPRWWKSKYNVSQGGRVNTINSELGPEYFDKICFHTEPFKTRTADNDVCFSYDEIMDMFDDGSIKKYAYKTRPMTEEDVDNVKYKGFNPLDYKKWIDGSR